ncbi:tannase/feruloyl esterase family alpha/beta hydrolase, partial [Pseudomonas viridiflava]|uniref:tannase/feruloyl esterase family alpha/beta hydrolase n=1 Tax=Pseudomonas viridiflava TaxID=33069 RepID=UPI000F0605B1
RRLMAHVGGCHGERAYFSGCSDGGREALVAAQRYPDDFNGIIAGAPALNFQVQKTLYHGWMALSNIGPDGKPILLASRLPLLHKAVLAKCDVLDGQIDGLIADPRLCNFDPA